MSAQAARSSLPWIAAAVAGVIAFVWLAFAIRIPEPAKVAGSAAAPVATVSLVDPVSIKGTMLLDPTPLFLPTEVNSSRRDYVPREPGGTFSAFAFKPVFAETELELHLPPQVAVPASPADALAGDPPGAPFESFGRLDAVVQPLIPRGAYVTIMEAGSGRGVFGSSLPDARPPETTVPWGPMEFIAAVDASGLVGPLVPTARSGVDEVDAYFGRYLAETLRIGQRLAPGFYRVSVGP